MGQVLFPLVLVSMASFAVLDGTTVSVSFDELPVAGEIRFPNSRATVLSPVARVVVLPVFVLVPVPVGGGTMGTVVVPDPDPEPVEAPAVRQGPVAGMSKFPQVVSPKSPPPPHAATAKPVSTKAETDARRMIDSHDPNDLSVNLYEFR